MGQSGPEKRTTHNINEGQRGPEKITLDDMSR